jgi:hypothetical protein
MSTFDREMSTIVWGMPKVGREMPKVDRKMSVAVTELLSIGMEMAMSLKEVPRNVWKYKQLELTCPHWVRNFRNLF